MASQYLEKQKCYPTQKTLGSNHFERKDSDFGYSARMPEGPRYDASSGS